MRAERQMKALLRGVCAGESEGALKRLFLPLPLVVRTGWRNARSFRKLRLLVRQKWPRRTIARAGAPQNIRRLIPLRARYVPGKPAGPKAGTYTVGRGLIVAQVSEKVADATSCQSGWATMVK